MTKSEVRTADPGATHRRLRDVLWTLFEQQDYRLDKAPTRPLHNLFLRTKTQATRVPGLCRYDSVVVDFELIDPKDKGPDAPARPASLTSTAYFAFLSRPTESYEEIAQDRPASPKECAKLGEDHPFFAAGDERSAMGAYRAWLGLSDTLRGGTKVPLECALSPLDRRSCEEAVLALPPDALSSVASCDTQAGQSCYKLYFDDKLITVISTGHVAPGPSAGQIVSARLDELIVLAHEVID